MNHIWVIEICHRGEWRFLTYRKTRAIARNAQKFSYPNVDTRIRKYVPA